MLSFEWSQIFVLHSLCSSFIRIPTFPRRYLPSTLHTHHPMEANKDTPGGGPILFSPNGSQKLKKQSIISVQSRDSFPIVDDDAPTQTQIQKRRIGKFLSSPISQLWVLGALFFLGPGMFCALNGLGVVASDIPWEQNSLFQFFHERRQMSLELRYSRKSLNSFGDIAKG